MFGSDFFQTLVALFAAISTGQPIEGPGYRLVPVYEVWHAKGGGALKKYSDAPSKAKADQVVAALQVLKHTAEVRGPVYKSVPVEKQVQVTPNADTSPMTDDDLSGAKWFDKNIWRYPTSNKTSELSQPFRGGFEAFKKALEDAGATVNMSVTYRSEERAYLMHYAYKIANGTVAAKDVPARPGVRINWVHATDAESKAAAAAMVSKFGIVYPPAFPSNHSSRTAVDMKVTWTGTLNVKNKDGTVAKITSTPRTGAGNTDLHAVGATYGVVKLVGDGPHWSANGR